MSLVSRSLSIVTRCPVLYRSSYIPIRYYRDNRDTVVESAKKTASNLAESAQSGAHTAKEKLNKAANRVSETMASTYNDMNQDPNSGWETGMNKVSEMGSKIKHRAQETQMAAEDGANQMAFKAKNRSKKSDAADSWSASGMSRDEDHDFAATNSDSDSDSRSVTEKIGDAAKDGMSTIYRGMSNMADSVKDKLSADSTEQNGLDWSERASVMGDDVQNKSTRKSKPNSDENPYL